MMLAPRGTHREGPDPRTEGDDHAWLLRQYRHELRYLSGRVEELERSLRRRTRILGGAALLGGFIAVAATAFALLPLRHADPVPGPVTEPEPADQPSIVVEPAAEPVPAAEGTAPSASAGDAAPDGPDLADLLLAAPEPAIDDEGTAPSASAGDAAPDGPDLADLLLAAPEPAIDDEGTGSGAAIDEGGTLYAATVPVNLRDGPSGTAQVLAVVPEGGMVRGLGHQGAWLRVAFTDDRAESMTGYIHGTFLRPIGRAPATPATR